MGFGAHLIPFENMSDRFEYPHISIGAGGRDFVINSILAASTTPNKLLMVK